MTATGIQIENVLNKLLNMKGKYLMVSRYKGKGRPRKTDYESFNSLQERQDIVCADNLGCGFTTNYINKLK